MLVAALLLLVPACSDTSAEKADATREARQRNATSEEGSATTGMTVVSLTFDDASADQYVARSILAAHGMKATFFVSSAFVVRDEYYMTWGQLRSLADDGHEIGGHTLEHVDLGAIDEAEQRRQVCEDKEHLTRRGFSVSHFAYANAVPNETAQKVVKDCGYRSGRVVGGVGCPGCPPAESIPPSDPYRTRTPGTVAKATSLADMKNWVLTAEEGGGGWIQFVFHNICDGCTELSIRESDLVAFLGWLQPRASKGTVVKTVEQALDGSLAVRPRVAGDSG